MNLVVEKEKSPDYTTFGKLETGDLFKFYKFNINVPTMTNMFMKIRHKGYSLALDLGTSLVYGTAFSVIEDARVIPYNLVASAVVEPRL